ncbi:MAG: peptidoglycan-binding protein [Candidatus Pacebacteria bacterium]|nr:peptidoglycan-binding protein [Candidatus Paceibacterota bacterium]
MSWTPVPQAVDVTYHHFKMDTSPYVYDGQPTTHIGGLTAPGGKSFRAGTIQTFNNKSPLITLTASEYTELEYNVRSTNNMSPDSSYCFRVTALGDTAGITYVQTPNVSPRDKNFRHYGGGGGAGWLRNIEENHTTGTTTVEGGNQGGSSTSTLLEATTTPDAPQSTTTPSQGGGGGDLGFFTPKNNSFAFVNNLHQPLVLGDDVRPMCTNMKNRMLYGSRDNTTEGDVSELQTFLQKNGYFTSSITGYFGMHTENAVKAFQKDNNLIITGIAGKVTRGMIRDLGCVK